MKLADERLLKKAIEQAEKAGFEYLWRDLSGTDIMPNRWWSDRSRYLQLICSYDFAKAFWGTKEMLLVSTITGLGGVTAYKWIKASDNSVEIYEVISELSAFEYHLQQQIILPDNKKIQYLKKGIK